MKILITGGAGFIGSHLVDAYCAQGHTVHVIDNFSTGKKENVHPDAIIHNVDITQSQAVEAVFQEVLPEIVLHLAAQASIPKSVIDPEFDKQVNVVGTENVIAAAIVAQSVRQFVNVSTAGVLYGDAAVRPTPETAQPQLTNPYVIHKMQAEDAVTAAAAQGMSTVTVRLANVYGPRQNPKTEAGVIGIFIEALLAGRVPTINGDGLQTRDFVFIDDLVKAVLSVVDAGLTGLFHVGTGAETTVTQVLETIQTVLDTKAEAQHGPTVEGEQRYSAISAAKLTAATGWQSTVSFVDGIQKTVEWYRSQ